MANKRSLKRAINSICDELFVEAVAASLYGNDVNADNADALLASIIKMQSNNINRISHPEPGIAAKHYYRDLKENFSAEASEIIDQINNL